MSIAGSAGRLLCITHVVPVPPRAGNEYRIHRLLSWLVADGWEVRVMVCPAVPPSVEQLAALAAAPYDVEVCPHDDEVPGMIERLGEVNPLLEADGRVSTDLVEVARVRVLDLVRGFCPDALIERVAQLDEAWRPDVVLAEYLFLTRAFPVLRSGVVKVVDTIDVFSAKADKVETHGVSDGYALTRGEEASLLRPADLVVAIQPDEAMALAALLPQTVVVSAGVDVPVPADAGHDPSGHPVVLVVASANPMNVAGLQGFLTEAWPAVRSAVPDVVLRMVGQAGELLTRPLPEGVELAGFVDDIAGAYADASVVINPTIAGTGLKIKTLEAMAHGRSVVTWPAGIDGMSAALRRRCAVVDDWPSFAAAVVAALAEPVLDGDAGALQDELQASRVYERLSTTLHAMVAAQRPRPRLRAAASRSAPLTVVPPMRLLTLFVQHGRRAYPTALAELQGLLSQCLPSVQHDLLVIDNSLTRPPMRLLRSRRGPRIVPGSNASGEFSAWDDGITIVGDALDGYDAVALVTSAFQQYDAIRHLSLLNPAMVAAVRDERIALGHIDHFDQPVWADGATVQSWVRSSFVLLAPDEVRRLGSLVSIGQSRRHGLFTEDPTAPFAANAPLSDNLRALLLGWITGEGTGQGVTWHSRFELTVDTLPRFRSKATAILDELLLSHRLRVQGCAVVDLRTYADR